MKKSITKKKLVAFAVFFSVAALSVVGYQSYLNASSHREAPMIANDPLADNTDLYAFRSPDDTNTVTIIANYIPAELPYAGPNYYSFGKGVRYEVHINNGASLSQDQIIYRFTFSQTDEDSTTFFNIRLGKQNLKTTYICEKSTDGGSTFNTIVANGTVPPPNIGPRSIDSSGIGLGMTYQALMQAAITTASTGETVFCGPVDDPFFVDLGGIFDLGQTRAGGTGVNAPKDGLACKNVHAICIKVPISMLQRNGKDVAQAVNILDSSFVIGVWASASRQQVRTLNGDGTVSTSGSWIQISRLGMPLTNEAVDPIGVKDYWNSLTPYNEGSYFDAYFTNPELALYMDNTEYGGAIPALSALRIQRASPTVVGAVGFGDNQNGLYPLYGNAVTDGTALDTAIFGKYLLRPNAPRSVDILPIFHTGVPNLVPYQLATGKTSGDPLTPGKPFINNFLPTFGDMLRLNMAVPVTQRNDPNFSSLGLIQAAVLGLTDTTYNKTTALQFIPNMDGFPNGRRLEDDVTRIELQAVSGVVLAAIGLGYDDWTIGTSLVTPDLLNVYTYSTGVNQNDTTFQTSFPYVQTPWSGYGLCSGGASFVSAINPTPSLNIGAPVALMELYPNPATSSTTLKVRLTERTRITLRILDSTGKLVYTPINAEMKDAGTYEVSINVGSISNGVYFAVLANNGQTVQSLRLVVTK